MFIRLSYLDPTNPNGTIWWTLVLFDLFGLVNFLATQLPQRRYKFWQSDHEFSEICHSDLIYFVFVDKLHFRCISVSNINSRWLFWADNPIDIFPSSIFIAKWQLAEEIFKNQKIPPPMLGFEPLAYEARTIPQDRLGKWVWRVLKSVLNKACPIIFNLAVSRKFGQFEKCRIKENYQNGCHSITTGHHD